MPGRYEYVFATGTDWYGGAPLFGPQHLELDAPLDFGASVSRKKGHLIDLRVPNDITVCDFAIRQWLVLTRRSAPAANTGRQAGPATGYVFPHASQFPHTTI